MGFFSSLTGGQKTKVPGTGFYNLPKELQDQYKSFYNSIPGATAASNFILPDFNSDQTLAFQMARDAANPTAPQISNLVQAYQNPFDQSVIDTINREAVGQNSLLKQAQNEAGAFGSNRQFLGANDVDLTRLNQIGTFKQSQFNNSLNTALGQQQQGINNLLNIGGLQQDQQYQNQLAPYKGLTAQAGLLQPVVNYMGQSTQPQTIKTGGGLGGIASLAGNVASLATGNPGFSMVGNAFGGGGGFNPLSAVGNGGGFFNNIGSFFGGGLKNYTGLSSANAGFQGLF